MAPQARCCACEGIGSVLPIRLNHSAEQRDGIVKPVRIINELLNAHRNLYGLVEATGLSACRGCFGDLLGALELGLHLREAGFDHRFNWFRFHVRSLLVCMSHARLDRPRSPPDFEQYSGSVKAR